MLCRHLVNVSTLGVFIWLSPPSWSADASILATQQENNCENVDELVINTVQEIKDLHRSFQIILHLGRKNFVQEMEAHPRQLGFDLPRRHSLRMGDNRVPHTPRRGKSAIEQYRIVASLLEKYVANFNQDLAKSPGRIGMFFTTEILYAMSQTFSGYAQAKAYECEPVLTSGDFGAEAGHGRLVTYFFFLDPNASILVVSTRQEKKLIGADVELKPKKFITEAQVRFDLKSGEVSYHHRYVVDKKEKRWTTSS